MATEDQKLKAVQEVLNWIGNNDPTTVGDPDEDIVAALSKTTVPERMTAMSKKKFVDDSVAWLP